MSHFYLTLPSNSSMDFLSSKSLTNHKTTLQNEISLQGEWEVGLSESIFPKNRLNVGEDQQVEVNMYTIKYPVGRENYSEAIFKTESDLLEIHDHYVMARISKGYYKDVASIVNKINRELSLSLEYFFTIIGMPKQFRSRPKRDGWVQFWYDENTNLVSVFALAYTEVMMTNDLIDTLGFARNDFPFDIRVPN